MPTKIPGLPPVPASITDPALRQWMQSFAETVAIRAGQQGDPLDRAVTVRELYAAGVVNIPQNSSSVASGTVDFESGGAESDILTDLTPPPAVQGLQVSQTPNAVLFRWATSPDRIIRGVSIYRAGPYEILPDPLPAFSDASPIGFSSGESFTDSALAPQRYYFYWLTSVSYAGVEGPAHSVSGEQMLSLATSDQILEEVEASISELHLGSGLTGRVNKIEPLESGLAQEIIDRSNADSVESSARISAVNTLNGRVDTVASDLSTETANRIAAVQTEQTARVNADNSLSGSITAEAGRIDQVVSDLSDETTNRIAAIQSEQTARTNADNSLASDISTVQATVGNHTASIQQLSSTQTSLTNDVASIKAEYTLSLDVNGYVSGYSAINDGTSSSFLFRTDTFAIGSPGATNLSFVVQDGAVVFNGASIANGTITGQAIAANTITSAEITGDSGFFSDIGVDVIYNSGGSEQNYHMKIDLVNGFIHIK